MAFKYIINNSKNLNINELAITGIGEGNTLVEYPFPCVLHRKSTSYCTEGHMQGTAGRVQKIQTTPEIVVKLWVHQ